MPGPVEQSAIALENADSPLGKTIEAISGILGQIARSASSAAKGLAVPDPDFAAVKTDVDTLALAMSRVDEVATTARSAQVTLDTGDSGWAAAIGNALAEIQNLFTHRSTAIETIQSSIAGAKDVPGAIVLLGEQSDLAKRAATLLQQKMAELRGEARQGAERMRHILR